MASSSTTGVQQIQQVQSTIFKFDGKKFAMWKHLMELCLRSGSYREILEKGFDEKDKLTDEEKQQQVCDRSVNEKALFLICQSIELSVLEKIFHAKTAKDAWNSLLKTYEGADLVTRTRLQGLKRQFELMKQGKEENIHDYFSRIEKLVNEMKYNGDEITEKNVLEKIMCTLSNRFDYLVTAIDESKDLNTMTLNDLQASLESREMWMNERSESSMEQALKAQVNLRNEKENITCKQSKIKEA
ncbi:hypothetical protein RJ639_030181 [Escallonia herrerae]|uniref:Gag protein n=1 Tax=Escallonia herrerae TaxID=1293975 RepID=A0AA88X1F3_9ASTE|nr:hypothetical protein RJ639_030181 [Escallonia herrerae]